MVDVQLPRLITIGCVAHLQLQSFEATLRVRKSRGGGLAAYVVIPFYCFSIVMYCLSLGLAIEGN